MESRGHMHKEVQLNKTLIPLIVTIAFVVSACGSKTPSPDDSTQTVFIPGVEIPSQTETVYIPGVEIPSKTETVFIPGVDLPALPDGAAQPYQTFENWLVYTSQDGSYAFSYPPEAVLHTGGVIGFPADEKHEGLSPEEYIAQLEEKLPGDLCVNVKLVTGFLSIQTPDGEKYGPPCGVTGVGDYEIVNKTDQVQLGRQTIEAKGYEVYDERSGVRTFIHEFFMLTTPGGSRIWFGADWADQGKTYQDYLPDRVILLKMISSFQEIE
jgi:hypothetical protein